MLKRNDSQDQEAPAGLGLRTWRSVGLLRLLHELESAPLFSSLQRRIIFFNFIGLTLLIVGMTYLSNSKRNPLELEAEALLRRGQPLVSALVEDVGSGAPGLDPRRAAMLLEPMLEDSGLRAQFFALAPVAGEQPPERIEALLDRRLVRTGGNAAGEPDRYDAITPHGGPDEDVRLAVAGETTRSVRINGLGEIVVSVALPVRLPTGAVAGALQLSSISGDIEEFLHNERRSMLEVFVLMAIVSVLLSILLANMIVSPIRQLAQAAARSDGSDGIRPVGPDKPDIPDMTHRTDEIGELSGALIRMTNALYARIDAIESFAADVAHEIKNPLTSLRSAVETMQYAKTPQQAQRLIEVIRNDVTRMDRLLTDISNASRLDAELVRERMQPFDLGQLLTMLGGITETEGQGRRVRVETRLADQPLIARGLEGPIAQVITNLLNNALSFAPTDSTITVLGGRTASGGARVTVEDAGPGIAPENLDAIFERFYSERPHSEGFGNHSGLGLSISKQIVEAHGGSIRAENIMHPAEPETRRGARFVFELPG